MNFYDKHGTTVPDDRLNVYSDLCDSVNQVESSLTRKISTLERKMRAATRYKKTGKTAEKRKKRETP